MTDVATDIPEAAFLPAVDADPGNLSVRDALAEWLGERGEERPCGRCGNTLPDRRKARKGYVAADVTPGHECPVCGQPGVWRSGVHYDHQMRCPRQGCCMPWEPGRRSVFAGECPACSGTGAVPDIYVARSLAWRWLNRWGRVPTFWAGGFRWWYADEDHTAGRADTLPRRLFTGEALEMRYGPLWVGQETPSSALLLAITHVLACPSVLAIGDSAAEWEADTQEATR